MIVSLNIMGINEITNIKFNKCFLPDHQHQKRNRDDHGEEVRLSQFLSHNTGDCLTTSLLEKNPFYVTHT